MALDKVDFSKHAGVIFYFQKEYINKEIFDIKFLKYLQSKLEIYVIMTIFFVASKQDAKNQLEKAHEFLDVVKVYLEEQKY